MKTLHLPRTLEELWSLLLKEKRCGLYGGGTDLFVRARSGWALPETLICLERIEEMRVVREEGDHLFIGGAATHTAILSTPAVRHHVSVLVRALLTLGSPPVRNMATIGGNICTASPAGDALPALYVLQAEVELRSPGSSRVMAVDRFISGPGTTALQPYEILYGVRIGKDQGFGVHHFEKVGQRKALAISVASMAALVALSPAGTIEAIRLAWGSVAPTVVRAPRLEDWLRDRPLDRETLSEAAPFVDEVIAPIDDIRASAEYRRQVAANLLLRLSLYGEGRGSRE